MKRPYSSQQPPSSPCSSLTSSCRRNCWFGRCELIWNRGKIVFWSPTYWSQIYHQTNKIKNQYSSERIYDDKRIHWIFPRIAILSWFCNSSTWNTWTRCTFLDKYCDNEHDQCCAVSVRVQGFLRKSENVWSDYMLQGIEVNWLESLQANNFVGLFLTDVAPSCCSSL